MAHREGAAPAPADAAEWLAKREARKQTAGWVYDLFYDLQDSDPPAWDYWVERASGCERIRRNAVDCDFRITYTDDTSCYDTLRVVERRNRYLFRHP